MTLAQAAVTVNSAVAIVPPNDLVAEQQVLASMLLSAEKAQLLAAKMGEADFYRSRHRRLFRLLRDLVTSDSVVDYITVRSLARDEGALEEIGGTEYLDEIIGITPSTANVEAYAAILQEKTKLRRLLAMTANIQRSIAGVTMTAREICAMMEDEITALTPVGSADGPVTFASVITDTFNAIETAAQSGSGLTGIATGYRDLDRITSGFQPGQLFILAARPSMGKTALALELLKNITAGAGETGIIFSLEMERLLLGQRLLSSQSDVDNSKIRLGTVSVEDWGQLSTAGGILSTAPGYVDDASALTVADIRARCRAITRKTPLGLIVVDYLQLLADPGSKRDGRVQEVSAVSRGLKALSREMKCTVLALSQLSRKVDSREDRRPILSDLRDSGQIEQDADLVGFLYRDEVYDRNSPDTGTAEFIIAKNRNGPLGCVKLAFLASRTSFRSLEMDRSNEDAGM